ncbi:MAG: hypothetical protein CL609_13110 [Anaerolineaceae bacterium]|nr:hypothetical protein [Anaerolineaceae bacterium]
MVSFLFIALIMLLLAAILSQEPFVFTLLYILLAVFVLDLVWKRQVAKSIQVDRRMQARAFPDEPVQVQLKIDNKGWMPLVWGQLSEGFPPGVSIRTFQQVITLGGHQTQLLEYNFKVPKRGVYPIGPLNLTHGDLMGFSKDQRFTLHSQPLIVYPKVVPLQELGFPSISPLGNKKYHQPIFEDPTRPIGKRDYQRGDSQRRIDWRASASIGSLQVKLFEPAIALETAIFLDLNRDAYPQKRYIDAIELAISTAASIASWVVESRESVGLYTNGKNLLEDYQKPIVFPPAKGYAQLMEILEGLAKVQSMETQSIENLIHQQKVNLSWGATLVVIAGSAPQTLFDQMIQSQRVGLQVVLVLVGDVVGVDEIKTKANYLGVDCYHILYGIDLKSWAV